MHVDINALIARAEKRKAAPIKGKAKELTLKEQVLSLVSEANAHVAVERQVTRRAAITVMNRALASLSSLPEESRNAGVLREVGKFISLNQNTFSSVRNEPVHTDLLPIGHPLSTANLKVSESVARAAYAQWLSTDPSISDEHRSLVAAAHAFKPGSIERQHAFIRLRAVTASAIPSYFKIDELHAIVAAFGDGNSSAARRARVALQWRDRKGRWVEMGRGSNFNFRFPEGSLGSASGVYVGATPEGKGLIQVSGDKNLPDGIYPVDARNADTFVARIPTEALKKAGIKPQRRANDNFQAPNLEYLKAQRMDAPVGWKKGKDGSFNSDDNYTVKSENGKLSLYRQDENGNVTDKVGDAQDWAGINDLANADEVSYDKAKGQDSSQQAKQNADRAARRAEYNKNFDQLEEMIGSGKDQNGNDVPAGWDAEIVPGQLERVEQRRIGADQVVDQEAGKPSVRYTKTIGMKMDGNRELGPYDITATVGDDGSIIGNGKKYNDWADMENAFTQIIADNNNDPRVRAGQWPSVRALTPQEMAELRRGADENLAKMGKANKGLGPDRNVEPMRKAPDAKEIFERRMAGESLDQVAKSTGLTRQQVRKIEADYLAKNPQLREPKNVNAPDGMKLDFADPEQAAEDAGIPSDSPFKDIVNAWFDKFIKPVAPTAKLDNFEEGGYDGPNVSISADNEDDLLNAFRAYFGDDEATMQDLRDHSEPYTPGGGGSGDGGPGGRSPDGISPDDFNNLKKNVDNLFFAGGFNGEYQFVKGKDGNIDVEHSKVVDDKVQRLVIASISPDGSVTWSSDNDRAEHSENFMKALSTALFIDDMNGGVKRPDNFIYFDMETGETIDTMLHDVGESDFKDFFKNIVDKVHAAGGNIEDNEMSRELPDMLSYPSGSIVRIFLPNNISDETLKDIVKSAAWEDVNDDDESVQEYVDQINEQRGGSGDGGGTPPSGPSGESGDFGNDYGDRLVDAANDVVDINDSINENFFDDESTTSQEAGESLADEIFDHYSDQFDLAKDIAEDMNDNPSFYSTFNKKDFIDATVSKVLERVSDEFDSAAADLDEMPEHVDKDVFMRSLEEKLRSELDDYVESALAEYKDMYGGDDEPPSPGGGTPPKAPSPSSPSTPSLAKDFDVPTGAFQLRTVEYEPEGRVDEESTDYTDDPRRLALIFNPEDLVRALTQAVIGNSSDQLVNDILDYNEASPTELEDFLDNASPARVDGGNATGAGILDFNRGEEYVPAEALYNAVFEAGLDPNKVIATAYDSVWGDHRNMQRLHEDAGGAPTPEETQLVDDMLKQIDQIKQATPDGEPQISNIKQQETPNPLPGELITNNVPGWSSGGLFYAPDTDAYVPSQETPDKNGYSDNPEFLARNFENADLIEQFYEGIIDGSGAGLFDMGDGQAYEVPVEAIRDALQLQDTNTNELLSDITSRIQANEEQNPTPTPEPEAAPTPEPEAAPQPEQPSGVQFPGAREAGYSANNATKDISGNVLVAGTRIVATKDGKQGTVTAVQNDPEYVRVKFDDGSVAVRSATKVRSIQEGSVTAPAVVETPQPVNVEERINREVPPAPEFARSGNSFGVNDSTTVPQGIQPYISGGKVQTDFKEWGTRDAEIAKAANTRASLDAIDKIVNEELIPAKVSGDRAKIEEVSRKLSAIIKDIYGERQGISFGANKYTVDSNLASAYIYGTPQEWEAGNIKYIVSFEFDIRDEQNRNIGRGSRSITVTRSKDPDTGVTTSNIVPENRLLLIENARQKKNGFASAYNRYMENWYIANGIDRVDVHAAGGGRWQGGLVWALNGFGWKTTHQSDIKRALRLLESRADTPKEKAIVADLQKRANDSLNPDTGDYDLSKTPTPLEMALAGWYPGAKTWLGSEAIVNLDWNGTKKLVPSAVEQKQAVNYRNQKNAEVRVKNNVNRPNASGAAVLYVASDEFKTNHPNVPGSSIEEINYALKNNVSLAILSPQAKNDLNKIVNKEILNKDSKLPIKDAFNLHTALLGEQRAENAVPDAFSVAGEPLTMFTADDFANGTKLNDAGYDVKELTGDASGWNSTWKVTHRDSGQVFYVKNEKLSHDYFEGAGSSGEIEASTLIRALEMPGAYDARVSQADEDIIIMTEAAANLDTHSKPINAAKMRLNGLNMPDGTTFYGEDDQILGKLKNPEDLMRMSIIDIIMNNTDRHDNNWMVSVDNADNSVVITPIDHSLSRIPNDLASFKDQLRASLSYEIAASGDIYAVMGLLADKVGEDRMFALYTSEINRLISNLSNPLFMPKGKELERIIENFGSYQEFVAVVSGGLQEMIKPGTSLNGLFKSLSRSSFWWGV